MARPKKTDAPMPFILDSDERRDLLDAVVYSLTIYSINPGIVSDETIERLLDIRDRLMPK